MFKLFKKQNQKTDKEINNEYGKYYLPIFRDVFHEEKDEIIKLLLKDSVSTETDIKQVTMQMNFLLPVLQVHYKEYNINRLSMYLVIQTYKYLLSDYCTCNDNTEKLTLLTFMNNLLSSLKEIMLNKNTIRDLLLIRNDLHMVNHGFTYKNFFNKFCYTKDPYLSAEKQMFMNRLISTDLYSLEAIEYLYQQHTIYMVFTPKIVKNILEPVMKKQVKGHNVDVESNEYKEYSVNMFRSFDAMLNSKEFEKNTKYIKFFKNKIIKDMNKGMRDIKKYKSESEYATYVYHINYKTLFKLFNTMPIDENYEIQHPSDKDMIFINTYKMLYK